LFDNHVNSKYAALFNPRSEPTFGGNQPLRVPDLESSSVGVSSGTAAFVRQVTH